MKPKWVCAACGMFSSRKYSVQRHISSLHKGGAYLVSFIDYVVGRKIGYYPPTCAPTYKSKKMDSFDIMQEEMLREFTRNKVRKNLNCVTDFWADFLSNLKIS